MAKLKMSKIEIIAPMSDAQGIVDLVQRAGVVEVTKTEAQGLSFLDTGATISQFDKYINAANEANHTLSRYAPQKQSLAAKLNGREELSVADYMSKSAEADRTLVSCFDINANLKAIADNAAEVVRCRTSYDLVLPWINCDVPTSSTRIGRQFLFIGTFPKQYDRETLLIALAENAPQADAVDVEIISTDKSLTRAVIVCHSSVSEQMEETLRNLGFSKVSDPTKHPPKQRAERLKERITELQEDTKKRTEKIVSYSDKRDDIKFLIDYLEIRKDKYEALQKLGMTANVIVVTGYAAEKHALKLKKQIEDKFLSEITVFDPEEDEDVPVQLENNSFVRPAESIVRMYSMPSKNDIDPTTVTAFFYYFFFGAILSDAGYGLILALATGIIMKKFRVEEKMKDTLRLYFWCGISTIIWGILYGSFFGDIINVVRTELFNLPKTRLYLWADPLESLMQVMVWCFGFGLVHLFTGFFIKGYMLWRQKDKFGAFSATVPAVLLVAGAAPIFCGLFIAVPDSLKAYAPYVLAVGAILVVLTSGRESKSIGGKIASGLYGLYSLASGMLGDVLSYTRLLALGLATGVIASVVNLLGSMFGNQVTKIFVLAIVFVVGQVANMAINLIGTYVHTLRLQFVEFYPKFYEGGGRELKPLSIKTQFYRFKEEILNG